MSDYHKYVFKDGQFVGEFEEMYQKSATVPWQQDHTAYWVFSEIDVVILKQYKYESICDIGCGIGYFSNRLAYELKTRVTGIDISKTAWKRQGNYSLRSGLKPET